MQSLTKQQKAAKLINMHRKWFRHVIAYISWL